MENENQGLKDCRDRDKGRRRLVLYTVGPDLFATGGQSVDNFFNIWLKLLLFGAQKQTFLYTTQ